MASAKGQPILVQIEGVAENFRSDWQYIIAASRMSSALSLVTLFSVLAVVAKIADLINLGMPAVLALILAALFYFMAIGIIKLRAPAFLQDFQDYKAYDDKKNSHRWILWQFYRNLTRLKHGFSLLKESIDKQLSIETARVKRKQCPFVPVYAGKHVEQELRISLRGGPEKTYKMVAYEPVNFDRDLVMPFTLEEGGVVTRYVLPIREDDPKVDQKVKELFWIIFSEAAKEHKWWRMVAWFLIQVSIFLFLLALVLAVYFALTKTGASTPCDLKYV